MKRGLTSSYLYEGSCFIYIVCVQWCPTHIVLCFVFLRLVYPMLPVSLECPFFLAPQVFSNVYLYKANMFPKCQHTETTLHKQRYRSSLLYTGDYEAVTVSSCSLYKSMMCTQRTSTTTMFIVLCLTGPELKYKIYHTQWHYGSNLLMENIQLNYYIKKYLYFIQKHISTINFIIIICQYLLSHFSALRIFLVN